MTKFFVQFFWDFVHVQDYIVGTLSGVQVEPPTAAQWLTLLILWMSSLIVGAVIVAIRKGL